MGFDIFKSKSSQALQTSRNMAAMYNTSRPLECNTDGTDLVKGGEGSRGGHVIGHRLDGKPIYGSFEHKGNEGMSKDDHEYAASIHAHEFKRAKKDEREADKEYHKDQQSKHYAASR